MKKFRVQCESLTERDEKSGVPRRWHFDVGDRRDAEALAEIQCTECEYGCCASCVATVEVIP